MDDSISAMSGSVYGGIASWYDNDVRTVAEGVGGQRLEDVLSKLHSRGTYVYCYLVVLM
jgi:hypothetical protein